MRQHQGVMQVHTFFHFRRCRLQCREALPLAGMPAPRFKLVNGSFK